MRLPADRRGLERGLRATALVALGWLIVLALRPSRPAGRAVLEAAAWEPVRGDWTWDPPADSLALVLSTAPSPRVRDWLVALRRAGTAVLWVDGGIPPIVLEVEPRRDPAGGMLVRLGGPPGAGVSVADGLGLLDSLSLGAEGGGTMRLPPVVGPVSATAGATTAWAASAGVHTGRRILVLGSAGWEARFVAAALEERGWTVDARYAVAPGLDVAQGNPLPLDTASHAAVFVLDSTADRYAGTVARFVRSGGGLVLAGNVGVSLRQLSPGVVAGQGRHAAAITFEPAAPRRALAYVELRSLSADAVTLEAREGRPVVAAWRVGAGRVVQVGYRDTWRWRMQGGEGSVAAHRAWWADLVAGVAYAPSAADEPGNPAPLASLVAALGPASPRPPAEQPSVPRHPWLVAGVVLCLLLEWASRRLRGAR
jgi:hypothetical protein